MRVLLFLQRKQSLKESYVEHALSAIFKRGYEIGIFLLKLSAWK